MMRIMLINNTVFYEDDNKIYLNKETGLFFKEMKDLGNNINVFQISLKKTDLNSFANYELSNKGISIYHVRRKRSKLWSFIRAFFLGPFVILKSDFIYIFYPGPICQFLALCCILFNKSFGIYIRGEQGLETGLSKFIFKKSNIIFTISNKFTENVFKFKKNAYTIRPMISMNEDDVIVNRKYLNKKEYTLLYVGRIVSDKGIFELLHALKELREKGYKVKLNMVGSGTDIDEFKACANKLSVIDNINFFGMVSDKEQLKRIYLSSDIFVLPTYHEGFPRVLYEAMILGIPILTTFVGTIGYLMKDQYNCFKIDVQSSKSITAEVIKLLGNYEVYSEIARNATMTISAYLSDKKDTHAVQLSKYLKGVKKFKV